MACLMSVASLQVQIQARSGPAILLTRRQLDCSYTQSKSSFPVNKKLFRYSVFHVLPPPIYEAQQFPLPLPPSSLPLPSSLLPPSLCPPPSLLPPSSLPLPHLPACDNHSFLSVPGGVLRHDPGTSWGESCGSLLDCVWTSPVAQFPGRRKEASGTRYSCLQHAGGTCIG